MAPGPVVRTVNQYSWPNPMVSMGGTSQLIVFGLSSQSPATVGLPSNLPTCVYSAGPVRVAVNFTPYTARGSGVAMIEFTRRMFLPASTPRGRLLSSWERCPPFHTETSAGGVRRNPRLTPLKVPTPTICPPELMALARCSTQPDPDGSNELRSVMAPFRYTKACC